MRAAATGYDLAMTATVNGTELSRGTWSSRALLASARWSSVPRADVRLRPGDLLGSGTVGTGCLLEIRDETLGRYLEPGDTVSAGDRAPRRADRTGRAAPDAMTAAVDTLIARLADAERRLAEHAVAPVAAGPVGARSRRGRSAGRPARSGRTSPSSPPTGSRRRSASSSLPTNEPGPVRAREDRSGPHRGDRARPPHRSRRRSSSVSATRWPRSPTPLRSLARRGVDAPGHASRSAAR